MWRLLTTLPGLAKYSLFAPFLLVLDALDLDLAAFLESCPELCKLVRLHMSILAPFTGQYMAYGRTE